MERRRVSPEFKVAVLVLLGVAFLGGAAAVGLSTAITHPTSGQSSAIHWLFGIASSARSGMLGLFGGKAA